MVRWLILAALVVAPAVGATQAPPAGSSEPFVVEYYYKVRWGFADEFIRLFKKNHFPVLKRQIELGQAAGHRRGAALSRHRGRPLGLSRDDRVEERGGAARSVSRRGAQAPVPRPGPVSARGAAALRDPRGALGPAGGQRGPDAAVVPGRDLPR